MAPESGWRHKLYLVIFEADTRLGRFFDVLLLWAIVLSVFCVMLESDQSISVQYGTPLKYLEWFFTILFSLEYLIRLICVKHPVLYARSFFGLIDLVAVAPTYLSLFFPGTQALMVVRAVRLLRIFRILKLVRYLQESRTLIDAMRASRVKITVFLGAVLTLVLIMGTLMHLIEGGEPGFSSIFESMYWAIVTMTTVGYGDAVPATALGKFMASIIMIMGYGIIAVPTGIVSAEISKANKHEEVRASCPHCGTHKASSAAAFCYSCGSALKA